MWSGAILLPNAPRSASRAAVGFAFSRSRLVDEEAGRPTGRPAEADRRLEPGLDARRGVHDEERPVGRGEALDDLGYEVGVAGRVDEGDPGRLVLERRDGQAQRLAALLLLGLVVEMGRSVVDLAEALDRAGAEEEVLGEGRLAAAGVPRQDDAPEMGGVDVLHRHRRSYLTNSRLPGRSAKGALEGPGGVGRTLGPAMIVGYTPARDVRTFQVVDDQAPEGRE